MKNILLFFVGVVFLSACNPAAQSAEEEAKNTLPIGVWRAELTLRDGVEMPFNFEVKEQGETLQVALLNDEEQILLGTIRFQGDTVYMPMRVFNTEIIAKIQGNQLIGEWIKKDYDDYRLPFRATLGSRQRFAVSKSPASASDVTGKWKVYLENEDGSLEEAVGIFTQNEENVTGTFLTQTGDYRFLEGNVVEDVLKLSVFDGEHAFLFHADIASADSLANGMFWSGKHWKQGWSAVRDEDAALPDASTLTYLKEGYETLSFAFPNLVGDTISLSDERFQGNVVIVQLMGSWCPNCLDETQFLAPFYRQNKQRGVEVVALAYERLTDPQKAIKRLENLREKLQIEYPILLAGTDDKLDAAKTLPMLNQVLAFPTTIFIDRSGKVRKIHTGFSGPGTGAYYDTFTREFNLFVDKLLAE